MEAWTWQPDRRHSCAAAAADEAGTGTAEQDKAVGRHVTADMDCSMPCYCS